MPSYLRGLALANYRGIGPNIQKIGPFSDLNLFIGENNSGKSAVLDFISRHINLNNGLPTLSELEKHRTGATGPLRAAIAIASEEFCDRSINTFEEEGVRDRFRGTLRQLVKAWANEEDLVWMEAHPDSRRPWTIMGHGNISELGGLLPEQEWRVLWQAYTGSSGGDLRLWITQVLDSILHAQDTTVAEPRIIPAIRMIGPKGEKFSDYSGKGLINRLAAIQNPGHTNRAERKKFENINALLKAVTDNPSAEIEIPYDQEYVMVHMDELVLPLSSLGTGIHEVIMIGSFCTLSEGEIVCIEEPEIHLHPILQRKLIQYLKSNTNNQYFVATHSAAFIDTPDASIFHVARGVDQSIISPVKLRRERVSVCANLGYRASDILQSNCIIWVEGPSDRIYINCWIKKKDPSLIEGIHYSIMFYGGRLLNHLHALDEIASELIDLKSLNQHMCLVLDSDRSSKSSKINSTKLRLTNEIAVGRGMSWITKGREIENYIDPVKLHRVIKGIYGDTYHAPVLTGAFDRALEFYRAPKKRAKSISDSELIIYKDTDKVLVAKLICTEDPDFTVLDLEEKISELLNFIRAANK